MDGNDALAVYDTTSYARKVCIEETRPVLIEAMTYRVGHHTTSDDSSKYRTKEEVSWWKENNCPVKRLQGLVIDKKLWSLDEEESFVQKVITLKIHITYSVCAYVNIYTVYDIAIYTGYRRYQENIYTR